MPLNAEVLLGREEMGVVEITGLSACRACERCRELSSGLTRPGTWSRVSSSAASLSAHHTPAAALHLACCRCLAALHRVPEEGSGASPLG